MTDLRTLLHEADVADGSTLNLESLFRQAQRRTRGRRLVVALLTAAGALIAALIAVSSMRGVTGIDIDTVQPARPFVEDSKGEDSKPAEVVSAPAKGQPAEPARAADSTVSGTKESRTSEPPLALGPIAFNTDEGTPGGGYRLLLMNSDGSNLKPIRRLGLGPAWSPDARRLAFFWFCGTCDLTTIFTINPDGTGERDLGAIGSYPSWSPGGNMLVFSMQGYIDVAGQCQQVSSACSLGVVNADGSAYRRIGSGYAPDWGPDGRIVFNDTNVGSASQCNPAPKVGGGCDASLAIMNSDGTGIRSLGVTGIAPKWSPNGKRIIYYTASRGIYVINADGTGNRSVAPGNYAQPSWMSDSRHVVVIRYTSSWDLALIDVDSDFEVRLRSDSYTDALPAGAPL